MATILVHRKESKAETWHNVPQTQQGQWWKLGRHTLFIGDSNSPEFRFRCTQSEVQFAFADPPYGVGVAHWDGSVCWQHDWIADIASYVVVTPGLTNIDDFLRKTSMPYRWTFSCHLTNGMTRSKVGFGNWIPALLFSRQKVYRGCQDHLSIPIRPSHSDGLHHKGRKPREFVGWLMDLYSKPGDVVIDPFLGTGTTLIVAEELGRSCHGAEIDPGYGAHIIRRWEAFTGGKATCIEPPGLEEETGRERDRLPREVALMLDISNTKGE